MAKTKSKKPVSKAAPKSAKKATKPAKPLAKAKPAPKKAVKAKPAPKKVTKAVPKKVSKSAPLPKSKTAKKVVAKAVKKVVKAAAVKKTAPAKASKPLKKVAPAKTSAKPVKKPIEAIAKKSSKPAKSLKEETKKIKPADEELETEDIEMDSDLIDAEVDVEADLEEEEEDVIIEDEPKKKGRKSRGGHKDDKRKFDSEDFVRKQVIKIDLNKSLIKKSNVAQPKPYVNTDDNRSRYSDAELAEFKELILKKLDEAQTDYDLLKQTLSHADDHGTDDTSPTFKLLEDGSDVLSKEETAQLAARQEKYIISLKNALVRIENKTYGICRATGKLIPKERLRSVPHATLSIDAKLNQYS